MKRILAKIVPFLAMLAILLALGLAFVSCENGSTSGSSSSSGGATSGTGSSGGSTTTKPGVPRNVTPVYLAETNQIRVTWDPPSSGDTPSGYYVERSRNGETTESGPSYTSLSYTLSNVRASTEYSFRVRAENSAGEKGSWSSSKSITTPAAEDNTGAGTGTPTKPGVPRNVELKPQSSTELLITWDPPSSGDTPSKYYIGSSTTANGTYTDYASVAANYTYYRIYNLTPSASYYIKVRAENSAGVKGDWSTNSTPVTMPASGQAPNTGTGTGTATTTKPGYPRSISATAQSSTSISITWLAPNFGGTPTRYYIGRTTSLSNVTANNFTEIGSVSSSTFTYPDTGLSPSTTYYYSVRAENSAGKGDWGVFDDAKTLASSTGTGTGTGTGTTATAPAAPTNVRMSLLQPNENGFQITWTGVTGATSYNVYRSTSGTFGTTPWRTVSATSSSVDDTTVTMTYNNNYYYMIKAVNSAGEGSASTTRRVTIPKVSVKAYKPSNSDYITTSTTRIMRGMAKIGDIEIQVPRGYLTADAVTSDPVEINPGTYKLQTGTSGTVGTITLRDRDPIQLKPWNSYVINVYTGIATPTKLTFGYY